MIYSSDIYFISLPVWRIKYILMTTEKGYLLRHTEDLMPLQSSAFNFRQISMLPTIFL